MKKLYPLFNKILLFFLPFVCGILGAFGGADGTSKAWRRITIPIMIMGFAFLNTESILVITIMSMCGALSLGYGIPEPDGSDAGSTIGRFWYNIIFKKLEEKKKHRYSDFGTRGTTGLLIALSMISIPIINKNWLIYGLCSIGIILTNALISWRGFRIFKLFGKELTWVEFITWKLIILFACLIIYLK